MKWLETAFAEEVGGALLALGPVGIGLIRRLGEKEYRAPSVTPGVALRPRTHGQTDNFDGSRDSGGRCVGSHRRRRESRLAASNDRIAHSRRRRPRSLWATEGRSRNRNHDEETHNRVFLDALETLIDVTEHGE
jgi:hypothetical protein